MIRVALSVHVVRCGCTAAATIAVMLAAPLTAQQSGQNTVARAGVAGNDTTPRAISDRIASATQEYRVHGVARPVILGSLTTLPFGHAQPTVTCAVLRACLIELQSGETVLSRGTGDSERWEIRAGTGGPEGRTTLVYVKPRDCDLTTNLIVATDRRIYDLTLDSQPCAVAGSGPAASSNSTNPQQPYIRHLRFYYPDDADTGWTVRRSREPTAPDALALDFGYRLQKDKQFPWTPAHVFDDGVRVYIKLPVEARRSIAPVLLVLGPAGETTMVNYSLLGGDTYVTDRLFERAALVNREGGKERRLLIEKTARVAP